VSLSSCVNDDVMCLFINETLELCSAVQGGEDPYDALSL